MTNTLPVMLKKVKHLLFLTLMRELKDAIERIITISTQRGGNKISFNSFIFNTFSVFSVVKF